MTGLLRSMWGRALIAVLAISVAPAALRAEGTPECPQIITCVAGNVFTEPGDVDCNRSIGTDGLRPAGASAVLRSVQELHGEGRQRRLARLGRRRHGVAQELAPDPSTPTPTRTVSGTPPATSAPGTGTRTPNATATPPPPSTGTATITRTPTQNTATDYSFAYAFGEPGFVIPTIERPIGTAIGADGHMWIADARDRVLELDATGKYVRTVGASGSDPGYSTRRGGLASIPTATSTWPTRGTTASRNSRRTDSSSCSGGPPGPPRRISACPPA